MYAVIMAGGKGVRLRPYTTALPKPLVPIGDQHAILEIVLRQLASAGFTGCTIAIGHLGEIIRAYVGDGSQWGLRVDYSTEESPLGTMGPLLTMRERLPENFLVMNGDILTDLDYADVLHRHRDSGAPLTIATYARQVRIDFGVLTTDASKVVGFTEKPSLDYRVSMGVYGLTRATLDGYTAGLPLGFDELVLDLLGSGNPRTPTISTATGWTSAVPTTTTGPTRSSPAASPCCSRGPEQRMRILVLGSTGYLGAHVAERLGALKGARVLGGGRSPAADVPVDLATDSVERLAKTLASAAPDSVVNCLRRDRRGPGGAGGGQRPGARRPVRGNGSGLSLGQAGPSRFGRRVRPGDRQDSDGGVGGHRPTQRLRGHEAGRRRSPSRPRPWTHSSSGSATRWGPGHLPADCPAGSPGSCARRVRTRTRCSASGTCRRTATSSTHVTWHGRWSRR